MTKTQAVSRVSRRGGYFQGFFNIYISEACDSDDGDPDVEFEAWKFRELQRLKRDREAREAEEAEQVAFQTVFEFLHSNVGPPILWNG